MLVIVLIGYCIETFKWVSDSFVLHSLEFNVLLFFLVFSAFMSRWHCSKWFERVFNMKHNRLIKSIINEIFKEEWQVKELINKIEDIKSILRDFVFSIGLAIITFGMYFFPYSLIAYQLFFYILILTGTIGFIITFYYVKRESRVLGVILTLDTQEWKDFVLNMKIYMKENRRLKSRH